MQRNIWCFSQRSLLLMENKNSNAHRYWLLQICSAMGMMSQTTVLLSTPSSLTPKLIFQYFISCSNVSKFKWKREVYVLLLKVLAVILLILKAALFTSHIFQIIRITYSVFSLLNSVLMPCKQPIERNIIHSRIKNIWFYL